MDDFKKQINSEDDKVINDSGEEQVTNFESKDFSNDGVNEQRIVDVEILSENVSENLQQNNNIDNKRNQHTAMSEMNGNSISQENIPSNAEVNNDTVAQKSDVKSSTSYTYSGSALGNNARETFEPNRSTSENYSQSYYAQSQYSGQNRSKNTSANTKQDDGQSAGYQSSAYTNQAYERGYQSRYNSQSGKYKVPYKEHVTKKPKFRFVAALVAAAVLNLAVLGGAFALGHSLGNNKDAGGNKSYLSEQLKTEEGQTQSNSSSSGTTHTAATTGDKATTDIAKEVGPAVVGIKSTVQGQMSIFGGYSTSEAQGSGIILSADGYIVTNNHVVDDATSIEVQLNTGSEYTAKVVGTDEQTDLAVIKITPDEELTVANLGDSSKVEVGDTAIAIGNPMGLEFFGSVTQGIISAVNRTVQVDNRTMNLIQTDAAINTGNSGGALVNSKGEVIGINAVKVSTSGVEGMGFAIPISEAKPIISDLLDYGYVKGRPVIGLSTRDVTSYMAQQYGWPQGAQIMSVTTENARSAGLQQGDIVTKIDNQSVSKGSELTTYKDTKSPGDIVELEVYKYATGTIETVRVELSEQMPY